MLVALREYASLFYWGALFNLNSLFLRFVYTVAPFSALKNRVIEIFGTVGVKVTCDKDEIGKKLDKSMYKAELVVKDDRFFYKVFDATLGIGEAYMVRVLNKPQKNGHRVSHGYSAFDTPFYTEWND
jgi:hypothetical protein